MLNNLKKGKSAGFTIIEVLIVLAIAGLIMVVVFLAVPALNRNSHNHQYKTEADNLMSAYTEVSNNKGGTILTPTATNASDTSAVKSAANLKSITNVTITTTAPSSAPAAGTAIFVTGQVCTAQDSSTTTSTGATSRSVALVFGIEGATPVQCLDTK